MPVMYPKLTKCVKCGKDFITYHGDVIVNIDFLIKRFPKMFEPICPECRKKRIHEKIID